MARVCDICKKICSDGKCQSCGQYRASAGCIVCHKPLRECKCVEKGRK